MNGTKPLEWQLVYVVRLGETRGAFGEATSAAEQPVWDVGQRWLGIHRSGWGGDGDEEV